MADPGNRTEQVPSIDEAITTNPDGTPDLVKKTTHEVDPDDMFGTSGE